MSTNNKAKKFDAGSPGFLYSVIIAILTVFAAAGVSFPKSVEVLGMEFFTSLSSGGIYAIIGMFITSVAFPIYNFVKSGGKFTLSNIFGKTSTWIALGVALMSLIALTGFVLPDGTVEQIVGAVQAKDWMALITTFLTVILPTIVRFIKDRNQGT